MSGEQPKQFFEDFTGASSSKFELLPQSGSARKNYLASTTSKQYIVTENQHLAENESFLYFSEIFEQLGLNTPKIFTVSNDRSQYVQEFLGKQTLSEVIANEGLNSVTKSLVKQTLEKLYQLQVRTQGKIEYSKTFEYESYDRFPITNDLFYFKSFIVDVLEIAYHKSRLLKEFERITQFLEKLNPRGLMIRDFQARNILVDEDNRCYFIDYQSAMEGPLMYDVVSFLYQAKANFPEEFRQEMLEYYYSLWNDDQIIAELKNSLEPLKFIRFSQVLGAYGFRGLIQRKGHFLASLQLGIENLKNFSLAWEEMKNYPELFKIIQALASPPINLKIKQLTSLS